MLYSPSNSFSPPKCDPWSSLVEGDEQLDRPTVQQLLNYAMHVLHNFLGFRINKTAFCLGRYSLYLLLSKRAP